MFENHTGNADDSVGGESAIKEVKGTSVECVRG